MSVNRAPRAFPCLPAFPLSAKPNPSPVQSFSTQRASAHENHAATAMMSLVARSVRTAVASVPCMPVAEAMQVRCVHSKRQIKRRENHPIRHRLRKLAEKENPKPVPELQFEGTYTPPWTSFTGWSPAPATPAMELPFHVSRTDRAKELPVYSKGKHPYTATVVRKVEGSADELAKEITVLCGKPAEVRLGNHVWVRGHHTEKIRSFLISLGL